MYLNKSLIIVLYTSILSACSKFIEVEAPINTVNQQLVYSNNEQAIAVLNGVYTQMSIQPLDYSSGIMSTSFSVDCHLMSWFLLVISGCQELSITPILLLPKQIIFGVEHITHYIL
mgnify:CR=1 FL=1